MRIPELVAEKAPRNDSPSWASRAGPSDLDLITTHVDLSTAKQVCAACSGTASARTRYAPGAMDAGTLKLLWPQLLFKISWDLQHTLLIVKLGAEAQTKEIVGHSLCPILSRCVIFLFVNLEP
jgi:hypothetical protein